MILTVTMNPSVDTRYQLDELVIDDVNRVTPEVERLAHMVAHPVPEQTDLRALFERSECCQMCFYLDTEAERRVMAQLPGLAASRWCPTSPVSRKAAI